MAILYVVTHQHNPNGTTSWSKDHGSSEGGTAGMTCFRHM